MSAVKRSRCPEELERDSGGGGHGGNRGCSSGRDILFDDCICSSTGYVINSAVLIVSSTALYF